MQDSVNQQQAPRKKFLITAPRFIKVTSQVLFYISSIFISEVISHNIFPGFISAKLWLVLLLAAGAIVYYLQISPPPEDAKIDWFLMFNLLFYVLGIVAAFIPLTPYPPFH